MRALGPLLLLLSACASGMAAEVVDRDPGPDPDPDPEVMRPDAFALWLDTETNSYLGLEAATAVVTGEATAGLGLEGVESGPTESPTSLGAGETFRVEQPLHPGLNLVELRAKDLEGHVIGGNRSVLSADYQGEGAMDDTVAALPLDDATLSLVGSIAGDGLLSSFDPSTLIPEGTLIAEEAGCRIYAGRITLGEPVIGLAVQEGEGGTRTLLAHLVVPGLRVRFNGNCSISGESVRIDDGTNVSADVHVWVGLAPNAPDAPGGCITGFSSTSTNAQLHGFDIDLKLSGGGLFGLVLSLADELIGEIAEGFVEDMVEDMLVPAIDSAVGPALDGLDLLSIDEELELFGTTSLVRMCMTGMDQTLRLGAMVTSPGTPGEAPGAPALRTAVPAAPPSGALLLDPNLVGQLLFSAWKGGALEMEDIGAEAGLPLTVALLAAPVPGLRDLYDDTLNDRTPLQIDVSAGLAPIGYAATAEGADLGIGLGDLDLTIRAAGKTLFVIRTHVDMQLALEPVDGALVPTPIEEGSIFEVSIIESAVPLTPRVVRTLEGIITGLVDGQVADLVGGAAIELPDLGIPLSIADVEALPEGFLAIHLGTPAPPM